MQEHTPAAEARAKAQDCAACAAFNALRSAGHTVLRHSAANASNALYRAQDTEEAAAQYDDEVSIG